MSRYDRSRSRLYIDGCPYFNFLRRDPHYIERDVATIRDNSYYVRPPHTHHLGRDASALIWQPRRVRPVYAGLRRQTRPAIQRDLEQFGENFRLRHSPYAGLRDLAAYPPAYIEAPPPSIEGAPWRMREPTVHYPEYSRHRTVVRPAWRGVRRRSRAETLRDLEQFRDNFRIQYSPYAGLRDLAAYPEAYIDPPQPSMQGGPWRMR